MQNLKKKSQNEETDLLFYFAQNCKFAKRVQFHILVPGESSSNPFESSGLESSANVSLLRYLNFSSISAARSLIAARNSDLFSELTFPPYSTGSACLSIALIASENGLKYFCLELK